MVTRNVCITCQLNVPQSGKQRAAKLCVKNDVDGAIRIHELTSPDLNAKVFFYKKTVSGKLKNLSVVGSTPG